MAAVIQDQAMFRVDGVQEIAAEAHRDPDNATQRAWGRIIRDVGGLQWHDLRYLGVMPLQAAHIPDYPPPRALRGGLRSTARLASSSQLLSGRRRGTRVRPRPQRAL